MQYVRIIVVCCALCLKKIVIKWSIFLILISKLAKSQIIAGNEGGIETIIKVMNTHIDNDEICKRCCFLLCNMIKDKRNKIIHVSYFNFKK